ncbi:hypothetical protein HK096_009263 [Nowakowskiella sp. JEL0078]|nr:hypothetical protein HK096_009263 [Nowakowskiella sp. JEL0078]
MTGSFTSFHPTLILVLTNDYGLTEVTASLIYLTTSIPSIFVGPITGYVYDKFGLNSVLPISFIVQGAMYIVIAFEFPIPVFCVLMVFVGISYCMGITVFMPEISKCVDDANYDKAYALFNLIWSCGVFVGVRLKSVCTFEIRTKSVFIANQLQHLKWIGMASAFGEFLTCFKVGIKVEHNETSCYAACFAFRFATSNWFASLRL